MTATDPRAWLDQIKARADAATEGPWEAFEDCNMILADVGPVRELLVGEPEGDLVLDWGNGTRTADAEFIAHARTEHPAMAAALLAVMDAERNPASDAGQVGDQFDRGYNSGYANAYYEMRRAITNALGGDRG